MIATTPGGGKIIAGKFFVVEGEPGLSVPPGTEDPDGCFKDLLGRARAELKPEGFKKRGNNFYQIRGATLQVVHFQKSSFRISKGHPLDFTVNVNITIPDLVPGFDPKKPPLGDWHLSERIGKLDPEQLLDQWWEIGNPAHVDAMWPDVELRLREHVIPACNQATTKNGVAHLAARWPPLWIVVKEWLEANGLPVPE